jgi:serine phosphatase RsbU (regulator of sigma subunit)
MYKQLKETLVSISSKPLNEQKEILQEILKAWMGDNEQVDDITIIGIRI